MLFWNRLSVLFPLLLLLLLLCVSHSKLCVGERAYICVFGAKGSIATVKNCMEHQTYKRIQTVYSFVSVNVQAAPPLWHGIFSVSAIGGKLSIASLPKQIMLPWCIVNGFVCCSPSFDVCVAALFHFGCCMCVYIRCSHRIVPNVNDQQCISMKSSLNRMEWNRAANTQTHTRKIVSLSLLSSAHSPLSN